MNDTMLIEKLLTHDPSALAIFYNAFTPRLKRFIETKVSSKEDGEEVLQDTLFAFIEAVRDFHGKAKIETYLFSIASHKITDYYRRKKVRHVVFSKIVGAESFHSQQQTPEELYDSAQYRARIGTTLKKIFPRYRDMLVYKYLDNMTVEDIAEKLDTTVKSVESVLGRARKAFVKAFISI